MYRRQYLASITDRCLRRAWELHSIMNISLDDPIAHFVDQLRETYSHLYDITSSHGWWYFKPYQLRERPVQGWKLHLSATPAHALAMLEAVADLLIQQEIRWKVCVTIEQLIALLSVPSPLTQVGKFITIYPDTDNQAVELAALLHTRTSQFTGPIIPSDRRYIEGSQVYYRYGSFERRDFYDPETAVKTPYILTPDAKKVIDKRAPAHFSPAWATCPFPVFAVSQPSAQAGQGLFGRNLMVRGLLRQSAKGGVYAVSDGKSPLILKEARFSTNPDSFGRDARDRLTNEFNVLTQLSSLGIAPQPVELFDAERNRYLLMEHMPGQSLRAYIEQRNYLGDDHIEHLQFVCEAIIELVKQCHSAGVILRDLSPNNVLVTGKRCSLVDLENAHLVASSNAPFRAYTLSYVPHGSEKQERKTPAYDFYALGAVLFFILTGIDPFLSNEQDFAPCKEELLYTFLRDKRLLAMADCASRYLTWEQPTHEIVPADLVPQALTAKQVQVIHYEKEKPPFDQNMLLIDRDALLTNAVALADHLHHTATWQDEERLWQGSQQGEFFHPACFHTGTAGIAYYLCEIAQVTGDAKYYSYAAEIMDWTHTHYPFSASETPPGLYFGYGAVPWVLTMIADGLDQARYHEGAITLARQITSAPIPQLDITHGIAGIGLMHLEVYRRTGDKQQLEYARVLANRIAEQAEESKEGNTLWSLQGRHAWGFAHGAAGLAYYLLAMYTYGGDGDARYADLADRTGRSLIRVALPTAHERGLSWTKDASSDSSTAWTHWCNGASGVGTYLLDAARLLHNADFEDAAVRAANTVRFGHGFASCCQCHGLAGDGEYLLQAGRALARSDIEQDAHFIARKLYALRLHPDDLPGWAWPGEMDRSPAPDYMVGYCGIYSFLLRLFNKDLRRPLTVNWEMQL